MPLGYGYKEREATSYVDWGAIGKNLSDVLLKEREDRENRKAALDAEQRATQKLLAEPPQGQDASMSEYTLKYTDDLKKASLLNYKLLRSGQLDPRDFTIRNQNLTDSTNILFNLSKEYQEQYKSAMDDYLAGNLQDLTPFLMSHVEGYANFLNTKPIINQDDYTVTLAKMKFNKEKGIMEMSKDPNDFSSVSMLSNMIKQKYKKFDVQNNVGSFVKGLGEKLDTVIQMSTLNKMGSVTEIFDQTKRKNLPKDQQGIVMNFENAETKALTSLLATPFDYTSILTNSIKTAPNQEVYSYTWNAEEAKKNENLILLKVDPQTKGVTPQLTDNQKKDAIEHLRVQARLMYDEKAKTTQIIPQLESRYAPQYVYEANKAKQEKVQGTKNLAENFTNMIFGDASQSNLGTKALSSATGMQFYKTKNGVKVAQLDKNGKEGRSITWDFQKDNTKSKIRDFAKSIGQLSGSLDLDVDQFVENMIQFQKQNKFSNFNTTTESTGFDVLPTPPAAATATPATQQKPGGAARFNPSNTLDSRGFLQNQGMSGG
jgi:hypothetical protein